MSVKVECKTNLKEVNKQLDDFVSRLKSEDNLEAQCGYFDSKVHHDSGLALAGLMYILEEGSEKANIPPRRVFKGSGEMLGDVSNKSKVGEVAKRFLIEVTKDKVPTASIEELGELLKNITQSNFGRGSKLSLAPNRPSTVRTKGRNDPLVDTGELRDSIEVRVKRGE